MKLFNSGRYTKEGKGIDKDMPEKNGFLKFWEIAWAKRFKLIALNFMYFIPNIISVILAGLSYNVATSMYFTLSSQERISEVSENASDISSAPGAGFSNELFVKTLLFVVILFTVLPVFAAGPFRSGFAYILRSFTKREPCFLWTDYIGKTRSNLKFSLIASLINAFAGFVLMLNYSTVFAMSSLSAKGPGGMPRGFITIYLVALIFITVLFLIMSMYIYPMIVTFRLTLKQLYKNALLFAFVKWLPNIGIVLLDAALIIIPLFFINGAWSLYISAVLYAFIGISFIGFINMSYTYPVIKKYLIDNYKADKTKDPGEDVSDEQ